MLSRGDLGTSSTHLLLKYTVAPDFTLDYQRLLPPLQVEPSSWIYWTQSYPNILFYKFSWKQLETLEQIL